MNENLVFVTTRLFWQPDSGRKVSLYHYCKSLHEDYGYNVHIFTFLESGQEYDIGSEPDFIASVSVASRVSLWTVGANVLRHSRGDQVWPLQCCMFFSRENAIRLESLVRVLRPSVIMFDMIRTAPYVSSLEDTDALRILDMDDLLSKRYRGRLAKNDVSNLLGAFGSQRRWHAAFEALRDAVGRIILTVEQRRLERTEVELADGFDSVLFVSPLETREFNLRAQSSKGRTAALGVDFDFFATPFRLEESVGELSFVGNLKYGPNVDSLRFIVDRVLPMLQNKEVRLAVYGAAPSDLVDEFRSNPRVEIVGKVQDLRPYIQGSQVFVAPMTTGSGVKTKVLEAMAMGVPVVTNEVGAEGLLAEDGRDLVIRESPADLASAIDDLLLDSDRRAALGCRGQQYVRENHVWKSVLHVFGEIGL